MALPGLASLTTATTTTTSDDSSKKIRKPYTITKSRESWTEQEHDRFLEALQLSPAVLFLIICTRLSETYRYLPSFHISNSTFTGYHGDQPRLGFTT